MRFDGRNVLVAGGTGALGRAVALAFLAEGAAVVASGRRRSEGEALLAAAANAAGRLAFAEADVATPEGAARAVAEAGRRGPLHAVVNVVGGWTGGAPIAQADPGDLMRMVAANLAPGWHLLRAALPALAAAGGGAFVEIASLAAAGPQPGQAAYAASKAAALSLVLSAAEETRRAGVRVNAVLPGTMDTPANRSAMPEADRSAWVSTADVARTVLFLCSGEAAAVSGAAIPARRG
ncbi:MAG TPA: SDR family NAD(P)-dependent oxidoreductase [Anaeromyxobacteraceae bacterium]|nr:SDR family NAD(P)-dependent oxidoreductase [Anaeromyxobacteraceae bacterium]